MKRSVATSRGALSKGDETDIADGLGAAWIASGTAEDITPGDYEPDPVAAVDEDGKDGDGLDKLKVGELKERLEASGQPTDGKKDDLVARLRLSGAELSKTRIADIGGDEQSDNA